MLQSIDSCGQISKCQCESRNENQHGQARRLDGYRDGFDYLSHHHCQCRSPPRQILSLHWLRVFQVQVLFAACSLRDSLVIVMLPITVQCVWRRDSWHCFDTFIISSSRGLSWSKYHHMQAICMQWACLAQNTHCFGCLVSSISK